MKKENIKKAAKIIFEEAFWGDYKYTESDVEQILSEPSRETERYFIFQKALFNLKEPAILTKVFPEEEIKTYLRRIRTKQRFSWLEERIKIWRNVFWGEKNEIPRIKWKLTKSSFQQASLKERYKRLYQAQDRVLRVLFPEEIFHSFYLTGGTALNRFYYPVRYSEDLEFFTNENGVFRGEVRLVMEALEKAKIPFLKTVDTRDFVQLICFPEKESLKVYFVNDRVYRYGKSTFVQGIRIDDVVNVLTNKICSVISRDEAKDVADLVTICLNEDFVWDEVIEIAQRKEDFERIFLVERLRSFPVNLFSHCDFTKESTEKTYSSLLPVVISDIIKGGKNSLKGFLKNRKRRYLLKE